MVLYELFSFRDADKILESKGLLQEVKNVMVNVLFVKHVAIQTWFQKFGWGLEHYIFKETFWRWDAFKDKVAVSIELSLIDAVHRDSVKSSSVLLRCKNSSALLSLRNKRINSVGFSRNMFLKSGGFNL